MRRVVVKEPPRPPITHEDPGPEPSEMPDDEDEEADPDEPIWNVRVVDPATGAVIDEVEVLKGAFSPKPLGEEGKPLEPVEEPRPEATQAIADDAAAGAEAIADDATSSDSEPEPKTSLFEGIDWDDL